MRDPADLEQLASTVASEAAELISRSYGAAARIATKASATDVVTQTDLDAERLIRQRLSDATPASGILGEEGQNDVEDAELQWIIDPLDGTVNFLYGLPVTAVSIAAAIEGVVVAGAVADVVRGEVFSATLGLGARCDGAVLRTSTCTELSQALLLTGFSYSSQLRAAQAEVLRALLPAARDIRCFGSAALHLCWVAAGRADAYFERDIKVWDWSAGVLVAQEAGAFVEMPCPENDALTLAATAGVFEALRAHVVPIPERQA